MRPMAGRPAKRAPRGKRAKKPPDAELVKMSELSKRHREALARTRTDMRRLLDEARANGKAEKLGGSI